MNYNGFASVPQNVRLGDTVTTQHAAFGSIVWDIIDIDPEAGTATVYMRNPPPWWRSFDESKKGYPFGCGVWAQSDIRKWLRTEFLNGFAEEDRETIQPVKKKTYNLSGKHYDETIETLFLPSVSELGFKVDGDSVRDEGPAYKLFAAGDSNETLQKVATDGDYCAYWLRSPYSSYVSLVCYVNPSGFLLIGHACSCYERGLSAACVIKTSFRRA